ncbi:MAG: hypothetical protein R6V50_00580 [Thermoplasmatota archaeon]
MNIRSVSFDTSFLLKNSSIVDRIVKDLARDAIPCFITSTVVSELEQLRVWGRITSYEYKQAMKRWKISHAQVIDFKNRLFSSAFGKQCMVSMKKHHGVNEEDIVNDCSILVTVLKKGLDIFISEDYHFTSKITKEVIHEVVHAACSEYHQMCDVELYTTDAHTFYKAYNRGEVDLEMILSKMKVVKKPKKRMDSE